MTPETTSPAETIEEIAESIIRRGLPYSVFTDGEDYGTTKAWLVDHVLSALRNRDERAAKMADEYARRLRTVGSHSVAAGVEVLASEIRGGK